MPTIDDFRRRALSMIRKGQPEVLWPLPGLHFGNLLYIWMQAAIRQKRGASARVLDVAAADGWYEEFPRSRQELVVPKNEVRFRFNRILGTFQIMGKDHAAEDIDWFCQRYLLPEPGFQRFAESARERGLDQDSTVTVNVRRGDYYSVPEHRAKYGFDVRGFVMAALERQRSHAPFSKVFIISDGIDWCQEQLVPALKEQGLDVGYDTSKDGARDFAHLGWANRLILANSTFSYWGGYMATARTADSHVVAPAFHARAWNAGRSFHLHPAWDVVDGFFDVHDSTPLEPGDQRLDDPTQPRNDGN